MSRVFCGASRAVSMFVDASLLARFAYAWRGALRRIYGVEQPSQFRRFAPN